MLPRDGGALVRLRVSPDAKSTGLQGPYGDAALKLRVAAPAVGGKANAEVERFVAEKVAPSPRGWGSSGGSRVGKRPCSSTASA